MSSPTSSTGYLAFDLGAESGRAILATFTTATPAAKEDEAPPGERGRGAGVKAASESVDDGQRLTLTEVHRFDNLPQMLPSGRHWNLLELWANLQHGLREAARVARERGVALVSLGVDTWGVDFGLVGKSGQLLGLPYAYRDERHPPAQEKVNDQLGRAAIYDATGIHFLPFNTLGQLAAQRDAEPETLQYADRLVFMPDLLHYFFSGRQACEATIASTSQMIDARTGRWAVAMLEQLDMPTHFLQSTVEAGTVLGALRAEVAQAAGLEELEANQLEVIAPGSHDTASAVAAVPVAASVTGAAGGEGEPEGGWAYLSSGTWSLMGMELEEPRISEASREAGFTNERGVGGTIRFLKNIAGLWLVQQVRQDYAKRGESYDYAALTDLAGQAEPMRTLVNPDHPPFVAPGDMTGKIDAFAAATGQPAPQSPGEYVRCCLESLALTYRRTVDQLESVLGRKISVLHVVGGGGKNRLLNQMTADALHRKVVVGPVEATAIGNALTQAMGRGDVDDLAHLRAIVRRSFNPETVEPQNPAAFTAEIDRFTALLHPIGA